MESIVQKSTELGAARITPLITERSIIQWKPERSSRVDRWKKIALEASQQSGRREVPIIDPPQPLADLMDRAGPWDLGILLWEGETTRHLKPFLDRVKEGKGRTEAISCLVLIGPEGGFSTGEADLLCRRGMISVTLGDRILRTETAGPAVLAILQYAIGDMG
jgi:16S rRNA (uracil1498-N3)-methyltransferase